MSSSTPIEPDTRTKKIGRRNECFFYLTTKWTPPEGVEIEVKCTKGENFTLIHHGKRRRVHLLQQHERERAKFITMTQKELVVFFDRNRDNRKVGRWLTEQLTEAPLITKFCRKRILPHQRRRNRR